MTIHSVDEDVAAKACVSADVAAPARTIDKVASGSFYGSHAVGLKVLKNKLSEYVRLAASGETVLVTGRDRVVAKSYHPIRAAVRC